VEREDERKAFGRAWNYLNYNATAKWASLLSGVGTGLVYVALLVLLWLFADLMVHRGSLPSYADLPRTDQERFRDYWCGLSSEQRQADLEDLGLPAPASQPLSTDSPEKFDNLSSARQAFVWRAYLNNTLCERVGGEAGVLVLPAFRDLPDAEQDAFADY
jgi:hypothetical protein